MYAIIPFLKHTHTHFVTPGVSPTPQAFDRFRLLMMLLLPTLGRPVPKSQSLSHTQTAGLCV